MACVDKITAEVFKPRDDALRVEMSLMEVDIGISHASHLIQAMFHQTEGTIDLDLLHASMFATMALLATLGPHIDVLEATIGARTNTAVGLQPSK